LADRTDDAHLAPLEVDGQPRGRRLKVHPGSLDASAEGSTACTRRCGRSENRAWSRRWSGTRRR
jgi:hypothetical protein